MLDFGLQAQERDLPLIPFPVLLQRFEEPDLGLKLFASLRLGLQSRLKLLAPMRAGLKPKVFPLKVFAPTSAGHESLIGCIVELHHDMPVIIPAMF